MKDKLNIFSHKQAQILIYPVLLTGWILLTCLSCRNAFAAMPDLPPGQDLEAQAERFQREYSQEQRLREKERKKPSVEFAEKEDIILAPDISFELTRVRITGMTVFDPRRFDFIWNSYLGQNVNNKDLNNIARMIKRVYKDFGLLTTLTYFPPQDIKNGEVEIRVVEGKRGDLSVEGNKWYSSPSIAKYFHTFKGEPLDMGEVQKDMARLNDNPDLDVSAVLAPGKEPETVDIILKAKETVPYHVSAGIDNQGSRLTGRYRESFSFNTSNLTGNHDRLSLSAVFSKLSSGEFLSYQTPVGTYGAMAGLDAGFFEARLGQEYYHYDVTTTTEFYTPNVSFELYQSQDVQMNLRSGLKIKDIEKKQTTTTLTNERLRLPYVAIDIVKNSVAGQTRFSPQLSFSRPGLLGTSAKDNLFASRPGADMSFVKYDHTINHQQRLPWSSYIQIKSQFQAATRTLPTSEQLQLGGVNSVRGYPEGDYLADTGMNLTMDWHVPAVPIPPSWTIGTFSPRNQIDPFLFLDLGAGRLLERTESERKEKFLAGIGGGFQIHLKKNASLKLEWAKAVGDRPIKGTGPSTFHMSFQYGM